MRVLPPTRMSFSTALFGGLGEGAATDRPGAFDEGQGKFLKTFAGDFDLVAGFSTEEGEPHHDTLLAAESLLRLAGAYPQGGLLGL